MAYTGATPDTVGRRLDWMSQAACRAEDPELFSDPEREQAARVICAVRCPVRAHCLAAVLAVEAGTAEVMRSDMVAGLTAHERWRLDARAPGHTKEKPVLRFTAERPSCGSYLALLRHLAFGERVDHECWSAAVRRTRLPKPTKATQAKARAASLASSAPAAPRRRPEAPGKTPHERHVCRLAASGVPEYEIARRVGVSVPAVQRVRAAYGLDLDRETR
ncbi:WhiB family transcriptional regulator [Streptomyces sp. NPDC007903]|uniref:WhiB family transcriptional regulator n=1 Tax=Streptomyces sp. NPDC007903 TaxID=3364786 RepID=UPI0036E59984